MNRLFTHVFLEERVGELSFKQKCLKTRPEKNATVLFFHGIGGVGTLNSKEKTNPVTHGAPINGHHMLLRKCASEKKKRVEAPLKKHLEAYLSRDSSKNS